MNREKERELPMMQVNFIDTICLPIYEVMLFNWQCDFLWLNLSANWLCDWQAFGTLSDKLQPLVNGVLNNKEHWLQLAQNVQNRSSACNAGSNTNNDSMATTTTTTTLPASKDDNDDDDEDNNLNNNNTIVNNNRSPSLTNEDNIICNGTNSEIPKIVGKIGRLSSQNIFSPKQNGINCESFSPRDLAQEAMDQ